MPICANFLRGSGSALVILALPPALNGGYAGPTTLRRQYDRHQDCDCSDNEQDLQRLSFERAAGAGLNARPCESASAFLEPVVQARRDRGTLLAHRYVPGCRANTAFGRLRIELAQGLRFAGRAGAGRQHAIGKAWRVDG